MMVMIVNDWAAKRLMSVYWQILLEGHVARPSRPYSRKPAIELRYPEVQVPKYDDGVRLQKPLQV